MTISRDGLLEEEVPGPGPDLQHLPGEPDLSMVDDLPILNIELGELHWDVPLEIKLYRAGNLRA